MFLHKVRIANTPYNISNMFDINKSTAPHGRQEKIFFNIPKSRLQALEKTLPFKGPRLYNHFLNKVIKLDNYTKPQNLFLNPFKRLITSELALEQSKGDCNWANANFPVYNHFTYKV